MIVLGNTKIEREEAGPEAGDVLPYLPHVLMIVYSGLLLQDNDDGEIQPGLCLIYRAGVECVAISLIMLWGGAPSVHLRHPGNRGRGLQAAAGGFFRYRERGDFIHRHSYRSH